jgi:hypothetical protein
MFMRGIERVVSPEPHTGEDLVFAVTNCHPTRIALYAAAFHGGWHIEIMRSLDEMMEAVRSRKPKAVFYEHTDDGFAWDQYCSALSRQGIPFILLAHKACDETFLVLLGAGGYHAWGNPLTSEEIVKALELVEEVRGLAQPGLVNADWTAMREPDSFLP